MALREEFTNGIQETGTPPRFDRRRSHRRVCRAQPWKQRRTAARGVRAGARASAGSPSDMDQLQQLAELHASGALTDEEFAAAKAKILGG